MSEDSAKELIRRFLKNHNEAFSIRSKMTGRDPLPEKDISRLQVLVAEKREIFLSMAELVGEKVL